MIWKDTSSGTPMKPLSIAMSATTKVHALIISKGTSTGSDTIQKKMGTIENSRQKTFLKVYPHWQELFLIYTECRVRCTKVCVSFQDKWSHSGPVPRKVKLFFSLKILIIIFNVQWIGFTVHSDFCCKYTKNLNRWTNLEIDMLLFALHFCGLNLRQSFVANTWANQILQLIYGSTGVQVITPTSSTPF